MMPGIGRIGGDCESRSDCGKNQDALPKPAPGFRSCPSHLAPRP